MTSLDVVEQGVDHLGGEAVADEGALRPPHLEHAVGAQGLNSGAQRVAADVQGLDQLKLRGEPVAGLEFARNDRVGDFVDNLLDDRFAAYRAEQR